MDSTLEKNQGKVIENEVPCLKISRMAVPINLNASIRFSNNFIRIRDCPTEFDWFCLTSWKQCVPKTPNFASSPLTLAYLDVQTKKSTR